MNPDYKKLAQEALKEEERRKLEFETELSEKNALLKEKFKDVSDEELLSLRYKYNSNSFFNEYTKIEWQYACDISDERDRRSNIKSKSKREREEKSSVLGDICNHILTSLFRK